MVKHVGLITRSTVRVVARIRFKKLLGIDRADTPDHAGREVLLDAVNRSRRRGAQEARFELLAVGAVVDPFAGSGDPLARCNGRGVADHGHDVTMPARLGAQDAKAILCVVVGGPPAPPGLLLPAVASYQEGIFANAVLKEGIVPSAV